MGKKQSKPRDDFDFEIRQYHKFFTDGVIKEISFDRYQDNDVKLLFDPEVCQKYHELFSYQCK